MSSEKSSSKVQFDDPFAEEGVFDDKCEVCCSRCCCAPPPFRVALFPTILLLAATIVIWALFFYDVTGLCAADSDKPAPCVPYNQTDPVLNVTRLVRCPDDDHVCSYLTIANIPVANWALFFFVIIAGWAVLRAIVSICWWIFRALSGRNGVIWEFIKPLDWAVHLLVWDLLFFICFNRFLFSAEPLVYQVCTAISVVIAIVAIIYIVASLLATLIARTLARKARERASKFRHKAKLVDKVVKEKNASMASTFSFGLSNIASKAVKNTGKTAKAAAGGDDAETIKMDDLNERKISEEDLQKAFTKVDAKKRGVVNRKEMAEAAGVKGVYAKDLWDIFCPDPEGEIYFQEFVAGIREVERGLRDTVNELQNRMFISKIIRLILMGIFATLGFTIAMQAINLQITTLVSAIALLSVAITLALTGLTARVLNCFVFHLLSHPYYKGDTVLMAGDVVSIRKITLLNTFGITSENKWAMYDNNAIAPTRILNLTRSADAIFVYETPVHVDTSKKTLDTWERTIRAHVASKPESWRDMSFAITNVTPGTDLAPNRYVVEMKFFVRGANWVHSEIYYPLRADLWKVIHASALQLGVYGAPKDTDKETDVLPLITAEASKTSKIVDEDQDSASSSEAEKKKAKKKHSKKESKKDL